MFVQQLYTSCLAEAAYYIESEGEAAIIDPLRETEPYLELARQRGAKIRYIFETHFHADFVSGHIDLAKKTGAVIIYGPGAEAGYDILAARDGEKFNLGKVKIKVLHTPGHTLESSSYLLLDEEGSPHAVFTGDTLFAGDVGRPDLAVKSDLSKEDLAGLLYDSLRSKIMTLPDEVIVYPGHGAGSACGKNIGPENKTTIGEQKKYNYALQPMSKEEFVQQLTEGLPEPPKYFFMDAAINKQGYESIDKVMEENLKPLEVEAFIQENRAGAVILDARDADTFKTGFVHGSINIGLNGQYAVWVGTLLDAAKPVLVVADAGKEAEAVLRLARVGYENVKGYLKGGVDAWERSGRELDRVEAIEPVNFNTVYAGKPGVHLLDVRQPSEWESGIVPGAERVTLAHLQDHLKQLDRDDTYYVYCAGGYRSMMASSLLKGAGFRNVVNVNGGINKLREHGVRTAMPQGS